MDIQIVEITPERAQELLDGSNGFQNRKLKRRLVDKMVRDIQAGEFVLNGESIKIDSQGQVIDGQHRLRACIQAARSIQTVLVQGVATEAYRTVDHGAARGFSDTLRMEGRKNAAALSGAVLLVWRIETGRVLHSAPSTESESARVLDAHPGLEPWVRVINSDTVLRRISGGVVTPSALFTLFSEIDEELAGSFYERLSEGIGFDGTEDPSFILRRRLERDSVLERRAHRVSIAAWYVKAWNLLHAGKTCVRLIWGKKEGFPKMSGLA